MSMTVFLIAAVPAAIVFFVGVGTGSKVWATVTATTMGLVGIFTGSPHFLVIDLLFVASAYWITWRVIDKSKKSVNTGYKQGHTIPVKPQPLPTPENYPIQNDRLFTIFISLVVCGFLIWYFSDPIQKILAFIKN